MNKKYMVRLTDDERQPRVPMTKSGKTAASQIKHAHSLLPVAANGPHWSEAHVANAFRGHGQTGRNVRQRFVAQGVAAVLARKKQPPPSRQRLLDGAKAAPVIALRCGPPPQGQAQWTFQWRADQRVARHVVEPLA